MVFLRLAAAFGLSLVLIGCTDRSLSPVTPQALQVGTPKTIFVATNRTELPDGSFGPERSDKNSLLELTVSIPPNHTPGQLEFGYGDPDPQNKFTLAARHQFENRAAFDRRLNEQLNRYSPNERDVLVFVHGFNSTQTETAFRAAQLTHDLNTPGATVIYSWPSLGSPLGYAYDGDSVMFARDGLEDLLRHLRKAGAGRIVLAAHSMGTVLTMEVLRQIEIKTPNWSDENLAGVVLMSPDLDLDVFHSQMRRMERVPQPFLVFVSRKDTILSLSQRLRGTYSRERLGNLSSTDQVADLPIEVIDTTAFDKNADSSHFVTATSPALLSLLNQAKATHDAFSVNPRVIGIGAALPQTALITRREGQAAVLTLTGGTR
ncbi:alpha/beta hydrolase [Pseudophaeobacter flagellatus]|uniref:alpha/beta hydrolase n=1 Tax=Pseudophaeobacter flagellatus TaxID=2899119 RepID=UPI001E2D062F|nr:alpha/beta fold hydrolase [Pseudophaeobacter flagellatus]MCD9147064.1 alpha/beta fold hydrolase [Pseudophaeobacter flagellatus]